MVEQSLNTAEGIANLGVLVIIASFFIVTTFTVSVFLIKWFINIINRIVNNFNDNIDKLLIENKNQTETLKIVSEGLSSETFGRIKIYTSCSFNLSVERVVRIIDNIIVQNNIKDRESVEKKLKTQLYNIHNERKTEFESIIFRGKTLDKYTNEEWIRWVFDASINEIYKEQRNKHQTYLNIKIIYDRIILDFYNRVRFD